MSALYNDTVTGNWLAQLILSGLIMRGYVYTDSIADLRGADLAGFTRVHLFAGVGGWDLALQLAGWPDDLPVWTGSCPCQPFSAEGKKRGTDDDRHLWPEMRRLIAECRPPIVFGEQVASPAGREWLAGVRADLEELGYSVGAADLCAAGVGAPHIRQRLYWGAVGMVDSERSGLERLARHVGHRHEPGRIDSNEAGSTPASGVPSAWSDARIIQLRDGSLRRAQPGIQPLVDGIPAGLVPNSPEGMARYVNATAQASRQRLKGYGNAIVPQLAAAFVRAFALAAV